jgi:hypothetical protein
MKEEEKYEISASCESYEISSDCRSSFENVVAPGEGFEPARPRRATGLLAVCAICADAVRLSLKACALSTLPTGCESCVSFLSRRVPGTLLELGWCFLKSFHFVVVLDECFGKVV